MLEISEDAGDEGLLLRKGLKREEGILGPAVGEGLREDQRLLAEASQVVWKIGHRLKSGYSSFGMSGMSFG